MMKLEAEVRERRTTDELMEITFELNQRLSEAGKKAPTSETQCDAKAVKQ
jgi:hypothetical protein